MRGSLLFVFVAVLATTACGCSTAPVSDGNSSASHPETASLRALPEDGAWVRYHVNETETTDKASGKFAMKVDGEVVEKEKTVSKSEDVTLSYVGSVVEDGRPCRWVEVKTVIREEDGEKTWIRKMLVAEAGLLRNDGKLTDAQIVRAWSQKRDGSIIKLEKNRGSALVFLGTPGAVRHMTLSGQKRDFSYQSHRLQDAEAWRGSRHESRSMVGLVKVRTDAEYTAWIHPDLPAGFVRLDWKSATSFSAGGSVKITKIVEYSLEDAGTAAQSELPDYN